MPNLFQKLDTPPKDARGFLWTDYVELRCLTSQDGLYGEGQVVDLETEADELMADEEVDTDDVSDDGSEGADVEGDFLKNNEAVARKWADISARLSARKISMDGYWPFDIHEGVLYRKFDINNSRHVLYVALLIASALRYCVKNRQSEVTASLEEIGFHLFRSLMPFGWQVRPFGAHQNIADGFEGTLGQKFASLAAEVYPRYVRPENEFAPGNTGDGGLDIVAWHTLGDAARGHIPVAFAQCGCSPGDWEHKQYEGSPVNMDQKIGLQHPASNFYIMPHDMRSLTGGWERGDHIGTVILLDRVRIIRLVEQYALPGAFPVWPFVQETAQLRLAI